MRIFLFSFSLAISVSNVDDVRPVLDFYRGEEDVVAAFRRNQDILRQQQEEMLAQQQQQKAGSSFFGRGIFGRVCKISVFEGGSSFKILILVCLGYYWSCREWGSVSGQGVEVKKWRSGSEGQVFTKYTWLASALNTHDLIRFTVRINYNQIMFRCHEKNLNVQ